MHGKQCMGTTELGEPCQSVAMTSSHLCFSHNPDVRGDFIEASRKGGEVTRWRGEIDLPVFEGPLGIARALEELARQVSTGAMAPAVANSIGFLLSQSVKAYKTAHEVQRDTGEDAPIKLQHQETTQSFTLKLPWEVREDPEEDHPGED